MRRSCRSFPDASRFTIRRRKTRRFHERQAKQAAGSRSKDLSCPCHVGPETGSGNDGSRNCVCAYPMPAICGRRHPSFRPDWFFFFHFRSARSARYDEPGLRLMRKKGGFSVALSARAGGDGGTTTRGQRPGCHLLLLILPEPPAVPCLSRLSLGPRCVVFRSFID